MRGSVVSLGCQHKIYLFNKAFCDLSISAIYGYRSRHNFSCYFTCILIANGWQSLWLAVT
ncbi:hypothetical protein [Candidatus Symbiopectobacterium sp.]|uniref:hypothetical protein n=1 Tax=Candidatus Symbiopectobacterium sp. TaxID=2816440 RepID=UPI0025C3EE2D|nr:hypothetical protein [Candidatus Symbiopectobacterium sp.]